MWQLKAFSSVDEKNTKIKEIKAALEALAPKISEVKSLEVFVNVNPAEKYDFMLSTSFDNLDDLSVYAKHPDHVAVGGILKPVVESRACVDYEF